MLKLDIWPSAVKFPNRLDRKHTGQIALKILSLLADPKQSDSKLIKGTNISLMRADVGEYRILYHVEGDSLVVPLIGRRNDEDVYKKMERMGL